MGSIRLRRAVVGIAALLAIAGCTIVAPPTPVPTPTPPSGVTLADLEGWWNVSYRSAAAVRIDSDGAASFFSSIGNDRYDRPVWRIQFRPTPEGLETWEVGGYLRGACDKVGRYAVVERSPSSVHLERIEDECPGRARAWDGLVLTRAPVLAQVLGQWQAEAEPSCCLSVGDDLTYRMARDSGDSSELILEGTLHWDPDGQWLQFQGMKESPCGPSAIGTYTVKQGDKGRLRLECLEDVCAERRRALVNWGPFARDARMSRVAGRYRAKGADRYELELNPAGSFRLCDRGAGEAWIVREGVFEVEERRLELEDRRGEAACFEGPGEYAFSVDDGVLRVEAEADPCEARTGFLASYAEWVKEE